MVKSMSIPLKIGKAAQNKQKKRDALLRSAYELFTTVGYHKTTIMEIAIRAGVAKGTFYLYFHDKEAIRNALIIQKSRELLMEAVDALHRRSASEMDFADKLIYVSDYIITRLSKNIALLQFISKNLSWGMFMNSGGGNDPDAMAFHDFIAGLLTEDGVQLENPELLIYTTLELINSTCYHVILNGEPATYSEYKPYLYHCVRLLVEDAVVKD